MDATEFEIEAATRQTEDEIIAEHFVSHYKATVDAELEGVVDDIVDSALAVKTGDAKDIRIGFDVDVPSTSVISKRVESILRDGERYYRLSHDPKWRAFNGIFLNAPGIRSHYITSVSDALVRRGFHPLQDVDGILGMKEVLINEPWLKWKSRWIRSGILFLICAMSLVLTASLLYSDPSLAYRHHHLWWWLGAASVLPVLYRTSFAIRGEPDILKVRFDMDLGARNPEARDRLLSCFDMSVKNLDEIIAAPDTGAESLPEDVSVQEKVTEVV